MRKQAASLLKVRPERKNTEDKLEEQDIREQVNKRYGEEEETEGRQEVKIKVGFYSSWFWLFEICSEHSKMMKPGN